LLTIDVAAVTVVVSTRPRIGRRHEEAFGMHPLRPSRGTPVMAWVESGHRPGRIIAAGATRTRPVFPYPTVARYDGSGSIDDAANFVPYTPARPVRNDDRWVGESLYSHGYQTWPRVVNGQLVGI